MTCIFADSSSLPIDGQSISDLVPRMRALAVATRRAGVWNTPTLYVNDDRNLDDGHRRMGSAAPPKLIAYRRFVKALQSAGAGLLAGSDWL